jgi:hypothetical protein
MDLITRLTPVSFVYNQGDGRTRYGFIAEDTAAVNDILATHNASGTITGIDDRAILSVVVGAVKGLIGKVDGLAESVTTKTLSAMTATFKRVITDELCIGETCVTEAERKQLLGNQIQTSRTISTWIVSGGNNTAETATSSLENATGTTASSTPEATSGIPAQMDEVPSGEVSEEGQWVLTPFCHFRIRLRWGTSASKGIYC